MRRSPDITKAAAYKSKILRHSKLSPAAGAFPPNQLSDKAMSAIEDHVRKHVGPIPTVLHELLSFGIHLDVLPVGATKSRPFKTFVTMGMSAVPMKTPKDYSGPKRAELVVVLPPDWPTDEESLAKQGDEFSWPISWLKRVARMPSDFGTYVDDGHTVPNGDPPTPFAKSCGFVCWMVAPPVSFREAFERLGRGPRSVRFFQIVPLYREEMEIKLREGVGRLIELFAHAEQDFVGMVDPGRPNVAKGRGRGSKPG